MLVGITGKKQHGKSTVANMIASEYGFHIIQFSMPLKETLCYIFGWDYAQWEDGDWKDTPQDVCYGFTPRDLALTIGTTWGRGMVHPNLWVDAAMRFVDKSESPSIVIPDVRFNNEAEAIKERNGIIIEVVRSDAWRTVKTDRYTHESEKGIRAELVDFGVSVKTGETDTLRGVVRGYIERNLS